MRDNDGPLVLKATAGGWSATIVTLPGCQAEGSTVEEAMRHLAAQMHNFLQEHGPTVEYLQCLEDVGLSRTAFEAQLAKAAGVKPTRRPAARRTDGPIPVLQLKVTLRDVRPAIWRRVVVRRDMPLAGLHAVIQAAMGWEDCHLHSFDVRGTTYMTYEPDMDLEELDFVDTAGIPLDDFFKRPKDKLVYEYDFGDSWEHDVVVEKAFDDDSGVPRVIEGQRACPPEDVGGTPGYAEYVKALTNPRHPEHESWHEWRGPFDPDHFDIIAANTALARLRPRTRRSPRSR